MELNSLSIVIMVLVVPASFVLSSAAGLGGSLILVPALVLAIGAKQGVALAALLLAVNNLAKMGAYRKSLPIVESLLIAVAVMIGTAVGASLMVKAPESWIKVMVMAMLLATFAGDFFVTGPARKAWALLLALISGASSSWSGNTLLGQRPLSLWWGI